MTGRRAQRPGLARPATRRRWLPRLALLLLVVPLLAGAFGVPQVAKGDDLSDALAQQKALSARIAAERAQMSRLSTMQSNLSTEIASTRNDLNTISASLGDLQNRVTKLTARVAEVQANYAITVASLTELNNQLATIEHEEQQKSAELRQRKDLLASRVRAAYQVDQTPLLETILSAQSFADVISDVSDYLDMGQEDQALAAQIVHDQQVLATFQQQTTTTRDATNQARLDIAAQKKQLDLEVANLQQAQARLKALQAATAKALTTQRIAQGKLARNEKALAAALAENGRAQAALKKQIDKLVATEFANGSIPSVYNGTLQWPMGGEISQPFGCTGVPQEPPLGSCAHFHQAIDIVAPYGTPVRAAGGGTVVFVGYNPYDAPPQAWIVIIAHSSNLQTWYAHMQPSAPSGIYRGAVVSAGQLIGYEGSTGHSTGAHLDWRVELNGSFMDPRLFV